jgi:hypothetical protein
MLWIGLADLPPGVVFGHHGAFVELIRKTNLSLLREVQVDFYGSYSMLAKCISVMYVWLTVKS